jgi:hypothetical protein
MMNLATTLPLSHPDPLGTLQQRIVQRTWDRVRQLRVERAKDRIVVHGFTPSYYVKQLVLEAIRESCAGFPAETVFMNITVRDKRLPL